MAPRSPFSWLYRRLGHRYPGFFFALELHTALVISLATVGVFSLYYDGSTGEWLGVVGCVLGFTYLAIAIALRRTLPALEPLRRWIRGDRGPAATAHAWAVAVGLPYDLIRRDALIPIVFTVIPASITTVVILDVSALALIPILAGSLVAAIYGGLLHYFALEWGMRPVLVDISREVSPRLAAECSTPSLKVRLMMVMPLVNVITGMLVAALSDPGGGGSQLGVDVLVAVAVGSTISLELSFLVARSIISPIGDIRRAAAEVSAGNFDVSVPVTTGDEIGELAAAFNQMVRGLREREKIREAFGTYLDADVAEYILSDGFTDDGVEIEVSILFCDVRDFTAFAERASAHEVVAKLNELFEVAVPIVARHGGHVDKFEGDGMMVVFGAPRSYRDHAERAVRAALEIAATINGTDGHDSHDHAGGRLCVGVGVNTGKVIAGSIGGGGRLNFSVVGGTVNVASRVEAHTRRSDDDVLVTDATAAALGAEFVTASRGEVELKGVSRPVELFAPALAGAPAVRDLRQPEVSHRYGG